MERKPLADAIRAVATMADPEGDVTPSKFRVDPKIKPPRRKPSVVNKSQRSDYMKKYIKDYREEGKDYQKIPEKIKELRKKQRTEIKKKFDI